LLRVLEKLKGIGGSTPLVLFTVRVALFDPDAIEVARQMTLMCHQKFARINPLEFITAEFFQIGDLLTLLVADAFLAMDRQQYAFERILETARDLAQLSNFDALACVVRFLRREDVRAIVSTPIEWIEELWGRSGEKNPRTGAHTGGV
jgi:hypothetical protein